MVALVNPGKHFQSDKKPTADVTLGRLFYRESDIHQKKKKKNRRATLVKSSNGFGQPLMCVGDECYKLTTYAELKCIGS